jgi:signal transduction histidine kinase
LIAVAREARETKTHLVAHISEELRTLMTSVRSYADIWLAKVVGILGKAQTESTQRIQSNVERVEEMLDDLTEIAAVDTGEAKTQARPLAESATVTETPQEDTE